jgi:hypothetical protein
MTKQMIHNVEIERECLRAVEGEQMWVLLNQVKADRRQEFERFMYEFMMPIAAKTEPDVLNRTRILHPTQPNEDGTYTYIFLMDPVVAGGEYDIWKLLLKVYSPEQAEEHVKLWNESLASPQIGYVVTQSTW